MSARFESGGSLRTQRIMELLPEVLRPRPLRRAERVEQVLEEFGVLMTDLAGLRFDPALGASGRPAAMHERRPGRPSAGSHGTPADRHRPGGRPAVSWDGSGLMVTDRRGRTRPFRCAGSVESDVREPVRSRWSRRRPEVAELVWLETNPGIDRSRLTTGPIMRSLMLLDHQGFRLLTLAQFSFSWAEIAEVATGAGLPIVAYTFDCGFESAMRIRRLLFPRRWHHRKVLG